MSLFAAFFCLFMLQTLLYWCMSAWFFYFFFRTLQKFVQSLLVPLQSIQLTLFSSYPVKSQVYSVHFKALCKWPVTLMHYGRWADLDGHVYFVLLKIQTTLENGLLIDCQGSLKCTSLSVIVFYVKSGTYISVTIQKGLINNRQLLIKTTCLLLDLLVFQLQEGELSNQDVSPSSLETKSQHCLSRRMYAVEVMVVCRT